MYLHLKKNLPLSVSHFSRLMSSNTPLSSSLIRKKFIDYFVNENGHTYVRSSPIKPLSDPTLAFVNAGMNQFKPIFQGLSTAPWQKASNSQKCARVGGSHNDLDAVGNDGYHHTFFEMLGNWSFGDYFKKEACVMAWTLLTGPYKLHTDQLYVTYFAGDEKLNLEPDHECREIWREIGVEESHIIPFGVKENFWEMGLCGPCGPCTEIHVDHVAGRKNAGDRVNVGFPDLTELWNIVFIQYDRSIDGSLSALPQSHIDTGMGLERLVALLNGSSSNYDTDLFRPLMDTICKVTKAPAYCGTFDEKNDSFKRDQAYRILSDHARMVTVALADGIIPHHEHKLRWVLRRALKVASDVMNADEKLIIELTNHVTESLTDVYPEIGCNLKKVQLMIAHEADIVRSLQKEVPKDWRYLRRNVPGFEDLLLMGSHPTALTKAYEKLKNLQGPEVPASVSFHLYESHGLRPPMIEALAKIVGLKFDIEKHNEEMERQKLKSKLSTAAGQSCDGIAKKLLEEKVPQTDDTYKYTYSKTSNGYEFPSVTAKIVAVVVNGELQQEADASYENCGVVTDRTNFYHTAGGQASDTGVISLVEGQNSEPSKNSFTVSKVLAFGGYVVHFGLFKGSLKVGDSVKLDIEGDNRLCLMRNHTLAHLLNGEIQKLLIVPSQEGSLVHPSFIKHSFCLHGKDLAVDDVKNVQESIEKTIDDQLPVHRYSVLPWDVPTATTLIPNEVYPADSIHIIDVKRDNSIVSREACCGTHVHNTGDIGPFCITEVLKSKGKCVVCAVSGTNAEESKRNGTSLLLRVNKLLQDTGKLLAEVAEDPAVPELSPNQDNIKKQINSRVEKLRDLFERNESIFGDLRKKSTRLPYTSYMEGVSILEEISSVLQNVARLLSELEVSTNARGQRFLVHNLQSTSYLKSVLLHKLTRNVDIPIMLITATKDGEVKARCCVPKEMASAEFNASIWLDEVRSKFGVAESGPAAESDSWYSSNLSPVKINSRKRIKGALAGATYFARRQLQGADTPS